MGCVILRHAARTVLAYPVTLRCDHRAGCWPSVRVLKHRLSSFHRSLILYNTVCLTTRLLAFFARGQPSRLGIAAKPPGYQNPGPWLFFCGYRIQKPGSSFPARDSSFRPGFQISKPGFTSQTRASTYEPGFPISDPGFRSQTRVSDLEPSFQI